MSTESTPSAPWGVRILYYGTREADVTAYASQAVAEAVVASVPRHDRILSVRVIPPSRMRWFPDPTRGGGGTWTTLPA
jgi:hypothetical protein